MEGIVRKPWRVSSSLVRVNVSRNQGERSGDIAWMPCEVGVWRVDLDGESDPQSMVLVRRGTTSGIAPSMRWIPGCATLLFRRDTTCGLMLRCESDLANRMKRRQLILGEFDAPLLGSEEHREWYEFHVGGHSSTRDGIVTAQAATLVPAMEERSLH